MARQEIVAQISTYPGDVRHFQELLPHHIRLWGPSVERIVVTIDTHQAVSGRYRASNYDENLRKLRQVVEDARRSYPALESVDVDYSDAMRGEVAQYFFNRKMIPAKAWDGGYFHSFFFGLYATQARYIIHFDGDMLFGGGSKAWIGEAIDALNQHREVLMIAPAMAAARVMNPRPGALPIVAATSVRGHFSWISTSSSPPWARSPGSARAPSRGSSHACWDTSRK
jgi:hypothetical protein